MNAQSAARAIEPEQETDSYRSPPNNIEAEQAILGAILVNNEACDRVSSFLDPSHFFEAVHARIYEAAATLIRAGKLASPVTLKTYFERDETLKDIGGSAYLARLAGAASTIINAEEYGRAIYELAQRRKLIDIGTEIVNTSFDTPVDMNSTTRLLSATMSRTSGQLWRGCLPLVTLCDGVDGTATPASSGNAARWRSSTPSAISSNPIPPSGDAVPAKQVLITSWPRPCGAT